MNDVMQPFVPFLSPRFHSLRERREQRGRCCGAGDAGLIAKTGRGTGRPRGLERGQPFCGGGAGSLQFCASNKMALVWLACGFPQPGTEGRLPRPQSCLPSRAEGHKWQWHPPPQQRWMWRPAPQKAAGLVQAPGDRAPASEAPRSPAPWVPTGPADGNAVQRKHPSRVHGRTATCLGLSGADPA